MKSNPKQTWAVCPKCQSQDTTKNGTAPSKEGRVQRLRCNNCKHIWNDPTFPRQPLSVARASKPCAVGSLASTRSIGHSSTSPAAKASISSESKALQAPMAHHRKLELDIPLDWSPMGLLNFARAAQQNLVQVSMSFDQLGQAELEWNALSPALKTYIRARQHLDFALLLQLSSVFATLTTQPVLPAFDTFSDQKHLQIPLEPVKATRVSKTSKRNQKQRGAKSIKQTKSSKVKTEAPQQRARQINARSQSEPPETNVNSNSRSTEDPERKSWLETLTAFHEERQQWSQERDQLLRSVRDLEQNQSQNQSQITSVTHDFERLKKEVLENKPSVATKSVVSEATTASSAKPTQSIKARLSSSSSSKRVMPPKYTATEQANLERLASSLMANLVRLDGHQVRPQDIPHITGERGAWKTVLEHLMTLGKIQRQGEFIAITLVERLRRGLQTSGVKSQSGQKLK
jgi:hypothetical protein